MTIQTMGLTGRDSSRGRGAPLAPCVHACPTARATITVMLSGPPRRFARSTSAADGLDRRHAAEDHAHFLVLHRTGKAVTAHQESVARRHGMRPLDIDLDLGTRAQGTGNHVLGHIVGNLPLQLPAGAHFPNQAVIEGQLLEAVAAKAVGPTVAHVGQQGPVGQQRQHGGGGSHPLEIDARLAAAVDLGVRFFNGGRKAPPPEDGPSACDRPGARCRSKSCWPVRRRRGPPCRRPP